jgi:hypothetical protein
MKDGEALCPGHADAPATPQPSAPVVACKAPDWCGIPETGPDVRSKAFYAHCADGGAYVTDGTNIYCSRDCQFPKLPPLAAKPAEAKRRCPGEIKGGKRCALDYAHAEPCKPAEQPKPAKVECLFFGKSKLHGGEIHFRHWKNMHGIVMGTTVCDYHYLHEIEPKGGGSDVLHNDKVPERIVKPQMAHSMGIEDPTLPEAR